MSKISDIETFRDLEQMSRELESFKNELPLENNNEIENLINILDEMKKTPEEYNRLFSRLGWVAHGNLNYELMKKAVSMAKDQSVDMAEDLIIKQYEEMISSKNNFYLKNEFSYSREKYLELCIDDYFEERYYSCIPVMLLTIDGIVNDANNNIGVFATEDFSVWDSLIGHSGGLGKIMKDFVNKSRKKTNNQPISVPYRNGILHGRELKYDNKIVAIKSFALFFYVIDWLQDLKSENERKIEYDNRKTVVTWENMQKYRIEMQKVDELLNRWKPRVNIEYTEDNFDTMNPNSPEYTAKLFFDYLSKGNFGSPYNFFPTHLFGNFKNDKKNFITELKKQFENVTIRSINEIMVKDVAPAISNVSMDISYFRDDVLKQKDINLRMSYAKNNKIENRLAEGGLWTIINLQSIGSEFD